MKRDFGNWLEGWRLLGFVSGLLVLMCLAIAWSADFDVAGVRAVIRATARSSLLLFSLAFAASALDRLWRNDLTRWLRRNRRYLGLSFAASHGLHAVGIVSFVLLDPAQFHGAVSLGTITGGSLAYAFIIALAATSFDRTAVAIGPRAWRLLHTIGAYDIWLTFFISETMRAIPAPAYWLPVALLVAVMGLRLAGYRAAMRGRPAAAASVLRRENA